jgi:hypothetical protein
MAQPHPFFLLFLVLLFLSNTVHGESRFTASLSKSYAELLKLKLESGRDLLRKSGNISDENAVRLLVENYADFMTLCLQQDPAHYNKLVKAQEERLEQLHTYKEKSPWADYAKAEIRGHLAVSKLLFGNRLAAAWDIRKAYLQYEANSERYPTFIPNKKGYGVLQILIGSVPENYKWFLNIVGMRGTVKAGLSHLKEAATLDNPFKEEAILYHALVQLLLDEEENQSALDLVIKLSNAQPDNLLFNFVTVLLHKKTKQAEQGIQYFRNRPTGASYAAFPYMHHLAADLYLYKGDLANSIKENKTFLDLHQGKHYLKAANFKLYLAYWLGDHRPQARWYYKQIPQVGIDVTEEDNYAEQFVRRQEQPNQYLMVARLRSDGGYNKDALQVLNKMEFTHATSTAEKVEYLYRKARIYQGMAHTREAKQLYDSTIKAGEKTDLYFAPNAALQLGYIYQEENKPDKASYYFRKALAYDGTMYKNSIQAKAKLALASLK